MAETTTEHAAEIRAAFKALGWSSRKVSVRADHFSMGSSIDVTIKDPCVSTTKAKAIAEGAQSIRRCEISGEILGGGNRYVHVRHSRECEAAMAEKWIEPLRAALASIPEGDTSRIASIEGTEDAGVSRENRWMAKLWVGSRMRRQFSPDTEGGLASGAFDLALCLEEEGQA